MDEDEDTQWTDAARARYEDAAAAFAAVISAHVAETVKRSGRQRELGPYFESTDVIQAAAVAFNEAEFDWCGSFPLALGNDDFDEDDEGGDDEDEAEGDVLSVVGRWDYRLTDPVAVLSAGRQAYAKTWADDTEEDAEFAVQTVQNAVGELMHFPDLAQIEGVPGLQISQYWVNTFVHDGSETDEDDPFGMAGD